MGSIDPVVLGEWFDAYAARLVLYARQWLDRGAAEDAVQEVFVRLVQEGVAPENAKAWLFRAVRNQAISAARSRSRRQRREEAVAGERASWFVPQPGDLVDARDAEAAMARLEADQREIIVLRIWAGMTLAEVAATIGMPVSSAYDQYRGALRALRMQMESLCQSRHR